MFLCLSPSVSAYSVYQGTMSSTYINYFRDMCVNIKFDDDYVLFRSGDNDYTMIVGDLTYENKIFNGNNCIGYTITNNTSGGYGSTYHSISTSTETNFSLSVGDYIVYSNLGNYPDIMTEEGYYAKVTLIVVCVIGLCMFIGRIFAFVLRKYR